MEAYLYFFTLISLLIILLITPVWFAEAVEILNRSNSKLRYIPVVNEIRAEIIYWGFGPVTLSWILLVVFGAGNILSWWFAYGSVIYTIMHYGAFVAIAFWYIAKSINIFRVSRQLAMTSTLSNILSSIVYPIGYYMILNTCKLYRSINSDGRA